MVVGSWPSTGMPGTAREARISSKVLVYTLNIILTAVGRNCPHVYQGLIHTVWCGNAGRLIDALQLCKHALQMPMPMCLL